MNKLRNKLNLPGAVALLHTVRGVGFALRPDGETAERPA
jgi:DNA-binding response OmpR family regulator